MTPFTVATTFWNSFLASSSLITASEIGDKTFFITSIMSMQQSRIAVFLGSMAAMTVMNVCSLFLGILTTSIPIWIINCISIVLFIVFGCKMILDGWRMTEEESLAEYEEAKKVVMEQKNVDSEEEKKSKSWFGKNFLVFMQVFSVIFFAEWGDKSQLSTIILAAKENTLAVGVGAFLGYFICNSIAVVGARAIMRIISVRTVTIIGGFTFLLCAILSVISYSN